jgi:hypothetical protein
MTDYDDQPVISTDDIYYHLAKWIGRTVAIMMFCFLAGYIWGSF